MTFTTFQRAALTLALTASTAAAAVAQTASAPTAPPAAAVAATTAPAATLSMQQVLERVSALGFRDVREIERKSDKLFEIEARDDKGQGVELLVDARSGEILKQEMKNKGRRQ